VFNYSGETIILYEYNQKKIKLGKEIAKIKPDQVFDIEFNNEFNLNQDEGHKDEDDKRGSWLKSDKKMNMSTYIAFESLETKNIYNNVLRIDQISKQRHPIKESKETFMMTEIKYDVLKKNIYFYSPVVFHNKTKHLIIMNLIYNKNNTTMIKVEPGKISGIPLNLAEKGGVIEVKLDNGNEVRKFDVRALMESDNIREEIILNKTVFGFIYNDKTETTDSKSDKKKVVSLID